MLSVWEDTRPDMIYSIKKDTWEFLLTRKYGMFEHFRKASNYCKDKKVSLLTGMDIHVMADGLEPELSVDPMVEFDMFYFIE